MSAVLGIVALLPTRAVMCTALVLAVAAGCGSSSDKGASTAEPASTAVRSTSDYLKRFNVAIHHVDPGDRAMNAAHTPAQVVAAARRLRSRWIRVTAEIRAIPQTSGVKKYANQVVAAFERGSTRLSTELASPDPDSERLGNIWGQTDAAVGTALGRLYTVP